VDQGPTTTGNQKAANAKADENLIVSSDVDIAGIEAFIREITGCPDLLDRIVGNDNSLEVIKAQRAVLLVSFIFSLSEIVPGGPEAKAETHESSQGTQATERYACDRPKWRRPAPDLDR
jgi:hypothetical protein